MGTKRKSEKSWEKDKVEEYLGTERKCKTERNKIHANYVDFNKQINNQTQVEPTKISSIFVDHSCLSKEDTSIIGLK